MMASRLVKRLLDMDRRELWGRVSMASQREATRMAFLARSPRWRREGLAEAIGAGTPLLRSIRTALSRSDWCTSHEMLMRHVADAPGRFVLAASDRAHRVDLVRQHFPTAERHAAARADRVVNGRLDLLGYRGLTFGNENASGQIDWHLDPVNRRRAPGGFWSRVPYLAPEAGDHKIIWELNRHQTWLTLGRAYWLTSDERYRDAFIAQLDSWMQSNPPLSGVNWASMLELALRSLSWLWALQFFSTSDAGRSPDSEPWTVDLLLGLDRQLCLVEKNLSRYFSPNTHLLGEALALYVVGRSLPELRRASRWEALGGGILIEEMGRQIHADGGHAELSTHYHRYALDFYLLALAVARRTNDARATSFASAVDALARFARTMTDDSGRLPVIGDDDGGSLVPIGGRPSSDASDSLQLASCYLGDPSLAAGVPAEEVIWVAGVAPGRARPAAWPSGALPESGYYVSRSTRGDHLTIDAGRHGFLNGGHAHADALSIALTIRHRPFLIDPGTACYTIDPPLRDRFRSTRFHNTLTLDGRPQSIPAGPFHWRSTADATVLEWRADPGFDLFAGTHDAYRPCAHHRTVLSRPGCWYVVDRVLGAGVHRVDAHWHLDPEWAVTISRARSVRAEHPQGGTAWLITLRGESEVFRACPSTGLGWYAPVYGSVLPTTAVRTSQIAAAPLAMVTAIVESDDEPAVEEVPLARVAGGADQDGVAFTIRTRRWSEVVMFTRWAGETRGEDERATWSAGGLTTDARILCWREDETTAGPAVVVDGTVSGWRRPTSQQQERERSCAG